MNPLYSRLALSAGLLLATLFSVRAQTTTFERHFGARSTLDELLSAQATSDGGSVALGTTVNRSHGSTDLWLVKTNAAGDTLWTRTYGGAAAETGTAVQQTADGGYLLAGTVYSPGPTREDFYLVKTTAAGIVQWQRTFGGPEGEVCNSLALTADGGAILAGYTEDLQFGAPVNARIFLVKTDAAGALSWSQDYANADVFSEQAHAVQQTTDGGYIVAGEAAYQADDLLLKLTPQGAVAWRRSYASASGARGAAWSVQQTTDGGYIVGGTLQDYANNIYAARLTKTDALGVATQTYNVPGRNDQVRAVRQTSDGGYAMLTSYSGLSAELVKINASWQLEFTRTVPAGTQDQLVVGLHVAPNGYLLAGYSAQRSIGYEGMLIRYTTAGTLQWQRDYGTEGGDGFETGRDIAPTPDGGGVVLSEERTSSTNSQNRLRLTKLAANGLSQWTSTIDNPAAANLLAASIRPTPDGGFLVLAASSGNSSTTQLIKTTNLGRVQWRKDFPAFNVPAVFSKAIPTSDGGYAIITAKRTANPTSADRAWLLKLNSQGDTLWTRQFGTAGTTHAYDVVQTADGGYALAGRTFAGARQQQAWIVRTTATGQQVWSRTYGRANADRVTSIQPTTDGGFILGGYSEALGSQLLPQSMLLKLSAAGDSTWARLLPPVTSFTFGYRALPTADGGYVLLDITNPTPQGIADRTARLTKTNASGTVLWQRSFGAGTQPVLYSLEASADGGFLSAGSQLTAQGDIDVYVIKTDGNGNVLSGRPAATARPDLQLYPNPTRATARLQLPADLRASPLQLTLHDLLGRAVRRWALPAGAPAEVPLDVRGLSRGTYLLRIGGPAEGRQLSRRLVLE